MRQDPDVIMFGEIRDEQTLLAVLNAAETGHLVFATLHTNTATSTIQRALSFAPKDSDSIRYAFGSCLTAICCQRLLPRISGGRIIAHEIMIANPAIQNLIREGKFEQLQSKIQTGSSFGMHLMDDYIFNLLKNGDITQETALEFATHKEEMAKSIVKANKG